MQVLYSDNLIYVDVDETLIFWKTDEDPSDTIIEVEDPYMRGQKIKLVPHQRNIDLVIRNHGQGRTIIVWSAGGCYWAETIVRALKLDKYVSLVLAKPSIYIDDRDMADWGLNRVYLAKDYASHPSQNTKQKGKKNL